MTAKSKVNGINLKFERNVWITDDECNNIRVGYITLCKEPTPSYETLLYIVTAVFIVTLFVYSLL